MKHAYYINYYRDFGNTYTLYHAPLDFKPPEGWQRITRKQAEAKARAERQRSKEDPAFSGFASDTIIPHDLGEFEDIHSTKFIHDGLIIWRK